MRHLFKCNKCDRYTMKEICDCGSKAMLSRPLKYSPHDKFGAYRRMAKLGEYTNRGLL